MVSATAVRASKASMSRNCSAAASAGPTDDQLRPPSTVRRTVPAVPATQATLPLTGASPRNRTVGTPVSVSCQCGPCPVKPVVAASTATPAIAIDNFRCDIILGNYAYRSSKARSRTVSAVVQPGAAAIAAQPSTVPDL